MFDLIKECFGNDRVGRMSAWVSFSLDKHELACGELISLENNYKNNSYTIKKITFRGGVPNDIKKIAADSEETLSEPEFKKWLISKGYKDSFNDYYKMKNMVS